MTVTFTHLIRLVTELDNTGRGGLGLLKWNGQYLRLLTLVLWVTHSVRSVSLSCALIPAVRMSTQCRVKSIVRTCTFFSPEKWCLALTFESLWPYQQWNACDKSHLERAVAKRASVCKSISIYPPRCPLFFFNVALLSCWRSPNEVPWKDTRGFGFERCPVSRCHPKATLF